MYQLDASVNSFGPAGGEALAETLKTNQTLATILLSGKGSSKVTIHVDQLRQNTVDTLDYSDQGLHVDGATFIVAELLKVNTSVTNVSFDFQYFAIFRDVFFLILVFFHYLCSSMLWAIRSALRVPYLSESC
jgi:hypothetical protein